VVADRYGGGLYGDDPHAQPADRVLADLRGRTTWLPANSPAARGSRPTLGIEVAWDGPRSATFTLHCDPHEPAYINATALLSRIDRDLPRGATQLLLELGRTLQIVVPFAPDDALGVVEHLHWRGEGEEFYLEMLREDWFDDDEIAGFDDEALLRHAEQMGAFTPRLVRPTLRNAVAIDPPGQEFAERLTAAAPYLAPLLARLAEVRELPLPLGFREAPAHDLDFDYGHPGYAVVIDDDPPGAEIPRLVTELYDEMVDSELEAGLEPLPIGLLACGDLDAAEPLFRDFGRIAGRLAAEIATLDELARLCRESASDAPDPPSTPPSPLWGR
jgi:hypothetical protein